MDATHRSNSVAKGNGYQAVIDIPKWDDINPAKAGDNALIENGFMYWTSYADAWGTSRSSTTDRLAKLVAAGTAEVVDSCKKGSKLWKLKKP